MMHRRSEPEPLPRQVLEFESAPFKLKTEWVDVMGGQTGAAYQQFLALCIRGFCEYPNVIDSPFDVLRGDWFLTGVALHFPCSQ